jgi:hypothetical protein
MEEIMRVITTNELQLLSRAQLLELLEQISGQLGVLPAGSTARANALQNLALVRAVLAARGFALHHLKAPTP